MSADSPRALPRLAILPDFPEEQWPSMDLVAEMTASRLSDRHSDIFQVEALRPPFRNSFRRLRNIDRLANRFIGYPSFLRKRVRDYDLFHLCDHSYSQLVHVLPAERTGVFCHDLDTFRCLLEPAQEPRPRWFRAMARRILTGMQKAAVVFYTTEAVRRQIEHYGLLDTKRLVKAPLGIAAEFAAASSEPAGVFGTLSEPYLLHVGSCIPRKRVDVLLDVFAALRKQHPELRLVQIGGEWTPAQREQIGRLGFDGNAILQQRGLSRNDVAAAYRRAAAVLVTSEAEGFGLPVIEAMACGATVIASDLPVLREVGGSVVILCPIGDVPTWATAVNRILADPSARPSREQLKAQADQYSWERFSDIISGAYQNLLGLPESDSHRVAAPRLSSRSVA